MTLVIASQSSHTWDVVGTYIWYQWLEEIHYIAHPWYPIHKCEVVYNEFSEGVTMTPLNNKCCQKYLGKRRDKELQNVIFTKHDVLFLERKQNITFSLDNF